jgi:hypothetical protein
MASVTDVEESTVLLGVLGAEAYANELTKHRRLLRDAFTRAKNRSRLGLGG